MQGLLDFTHMTGELVKAMRLAAVDGICAGGGRDHADGNLRWHGSSRSHSCSCALVLPAPAWGHAISAGRAAGCCTGRAMDDAVERWGFSIGCASDALRAEAHRMYVGDGTDFRTRDDQALHPPGVGHVDAAIRRAICMQTKDSVIVSGVRCQTAAGAIGGAMMETVGLGFYFEDLPVGRRFLHRSHGDRGGYYQLRQLHRYGGSAVHQHGIPARRSDIKSTAPAAPELLFRRGIAGAVTGQHTGPAAFHIWTSKPVFAGDPCGMRCHREARLSRNRPGRG